MLGFESRQPHFSTLLTVLTADWEHESREKKKGKGFAFLRPEANFYFI